MRNGTLTGAGQNPAPPTEAGRQPNGQTDIICGKCKTTAPLDGYQFMLVGICACCRNDRAAEIAGNRFKRRMSKQEG